MEKIFPLIHTIILNTFKETISLYGKKNFTCTLPENISYDQYSEFPDIIWAAIFIDKHQNEFPQIFHNKICNKFCELKIFPSNYSLENYKPHFTLFNSLFDNTNCDNRLSKIPKRYLDILKNVQLEPVFGKANYYGELITKERFSVENTFNVASLQ